MRRHIVHLFRRAGDRPLSFVIVVPDWLTENGEGKTVRIKANKAVIALLAKAVGMPKSSVALGSGSTGRNKSVVVTCSFEKATAMVERLTSSLS